MLCIIAGAQLMFSSYSPLGMYQEILSWSWSLHSIYIEFIYHPWCQWISRNTSIQCDEYWQCWNPYFPDNDERMYRKDLAYQTPLVERESKLLLPINYLSTSFKKYTSVDLFSLSQKLCFLILFFSICIILCKWDPTIKTKNYSCMWNLYLHFPRSPGVPFFLSDVSLWCGCRWTDAS